MKTLHPTPCTLHSPVGRWQDATTLLAVYDGSDTLLQRFEYADGRMPVAMTAGGQVYYFGYDQVGSLRLVTDAAGTVVKRIDYDSFGNILSDSNPTFTVPFGFAGGLHDRDTGLVRFGARDYDPATGKWTAKDPIDFAGGDLNLGSYSFSNPINLIDISGYAPIPESENYYISVYKIRDWHYSRNTQDAQRSAERKANFMYISQSTTWNLQSDIASSYHRHGQGNEGNLKYVNILNSAELVFDKNENLVTSPINRGTYNYGDGPFSHLMLDMVPYWLWGNSPDDTTDALNRIWPVDGEAIPCP